MSRILWRSQILIQTKIADGPEIRAVFGGLRILSLTLALLTVFLPTISGCSPDEGGGDITIDAGILSCQRDEHSRPETALSLGVDTAQNGYICPQGDRDWYKIEVPADETVLQISLGMTIPLSPVEINYTVWTPDAQGGPGSVAAAPFFTGVGSQLDNIHCLAPGSYLLQINDAADDSSDLRNPYELAISTRADQDTNEPNNTDDSATALSSGQRATGYITCPGDHDHFKIDVPAGNLLKIHFESEISDYEPMVTLRDAQGRVLAMEVNRSGRVRPTMIDRYITLPAGGTYYVSVSDDDDFDSDPETPYALTVDFVTDTDPNEPNNSAETATDLSSTALSCGASWTPWIEATGTIGAPGDNDWFRVPLHDCNGGILEAHVEFDAAGMSNAEKWAFNSQVQAALTMVFPEPNSPCNQDAECGVLQLSCQEALDCAGVFEQCKPEGLCAGASVCLPTGFCGANRVQRNFECNSRFPECRAATQPNPPANRASFAAPLPLASEVFLRVSDFQSDGAAPDTSYRLRVRVRQEPDTHEPSNLFTNQLNLNTAVGRNRDLAAALPVYDCTGSNPTCCSNQPWTTGMISYENDLDWYGYDHPCPGEDCLLKFHYRVDAGPVDTVMNVYTGSSPWITVLASEQVASHPAISGFTGGTATTDRCLYAFQGHTGRNESEPYEYGVLVRDLRELYSDELTPTPESRDWAPDQRYSLCIEKVFNGCQAPCELASNGECTSPRD